MKELIEKIVDRFEKAKFDGNYTEAIWHRHGINKAIDIIQEEAKAYNESVKTNADYIRSLSDEELADMLHNIGSYVNDGEPLIDIWIGEKETTLDDSFGDILDWLEAEREG